MSVPDPNPEKVRCMFCEIVLDTEQGMKRGCCQQCYDHNLSRGVDLDGD